jgi:hypothetical protein
MKEDVVNDYLLKNQQRFKAEGNHQVFIKNYKQSITEINDRFLVNVSLEIGIPPIYLFGFIVFVIGLMFVQPVFMILGTTLTLTAVFWTHDFQRMMFRKGLRKAGYKESIKNLKSSEALEMVIYESDGIIKLV